MKSLGLLLLLLITVAFVSCKKCYTCSLDVECNTCTYSNMVVDICDNDFADRADYDSTVAAYESGGFECLANSFTESDNMCKKGSKSALEVWKESKMALGYTCTKD